jgi:transglutaminase-like putative cysteine protease
VSGYVYRPRLEEDEATSATHAWVEALLPGLEWVGFDPTNGGPAGEDHIRIAVGRDYADVPPTRGVFKGRAETELGVAVQVVRYGEPLADDELLIEMQASPPERDGEQPLQQQQEPRLQRRAERRAP